MPRRGRLSQAPHGADSSGETSGPSFPPEGREGPGRGGFGFLPGPGLGLRLGRLGEGDEVAVRILQAQLPRAPFTLLRAPGGIHVALDLLVDGVDARRMDVERPGEGGLALPGRLAREELEDDAVPRQLAPRRLTRLGEDAKELEPDPLVPRDRATECPWTSGGLQDRGDPGHDAASG